MTRPLRVSGLAVVVAAGIACGAGVPYGVEEPRLAPGPWGGPHIGMQVTDSGATLEFDCAHGRIDEALTLDRSGRFDAHGTYVLEHPGPRREGEEDQSRPVRYVGRVSGKSMSLMIGPLDGGDAIGAFTLEQGKPPRIFRCL